MHAVFSRSLNFYHLHVLLQVPSQPRTIWLPVKERTQVSIALSCGHTLRLELGSDPTGEGLNPIGLSPPQIPITSLDLLCYNLGVPMITSLGSIIC